MSSANGTGRVLRTRALYNKLVDAFREQPGNVAHAARAAGVSRTLAATAWRKGWRGISWARPISSRIQDEGDMAMLEAAQIQEQREKERQQRLALEEAERERVKAERVKTLAEELQIQQLMRKGTQQAGATVLALSSSVNQVVRLVMKKLFDESTSPDGKTVWTPKANVDLSLTDAMKMIREWGNVLAKFVLAGDVVISLGRETRGPDEGVNAVPDMSPEEVQDELDHLMKMAEGLKQRKIEDEAALARHEKPTLQ